MKQLFFILGIILLTAKASHAQSARYYKLKTPIIALGDTARWIDWYAVQYPATNQFYWALINDTVNHYVMKRGVIDVPQTVIDNWGTDDKVIPQWLESQKVWMKKPE